MVTTPYSGRATPRHGVVQAESGSGVGTKKEDTNFKAQNFNETQLHAHCKYDITFSVREAQFDAFYNVATQSFVKNGPGCAFRLDIVLGTVLGTVRLL